MKDKFYVLFSLENDTLTSTYNAFFVNEHPGLNKRFLEWAPPLKSRKLNERPSTHSDNPSNGDQKTVIDSKWIEIIHHKKLIAKIW